MLLQASLFSLADSWRVRPHLFTAARQRWEEDDIDRSAKPHLQVVRALSAGPLTSTLSMPACSVCSPPNAARVCCGLPMVLLP